MALTEPQKVDIRYRLGWSGRFHQFDSRLEQAMLAIETEPDSEALITNSLTDSPVGLLASLADIDAKLVSSHDRLKADAVGSIKLNRQEVKQLWREGRRFVGRLAALLGVEVRQDIYSANSYDSFAGFGGLSGGSSSNYVGK